MRSVGRSISTVCIWLKAKALAKEMGIMNFTRAQSWCTRFMKQNNLSIRCKTTLAQRLPTRVANRPGMLGTVPELTSGVPCPGPGHVCPGIY